MTTLLPEKFPTLRAHARKQSLVNDALAVIAAGVATGTIRNAAWKDAKDCLSRATDNAWCEAVQKPFFWGMGDEVPEPVRDLHYSISIMGLHDVIAASKKLAKSNLDHPAVAAMRAFTAEVLPLSLAVASLKDKVVKGRAPSDKPPVPENPDKVVRTCPVCFRQIAVVGRHMAHHGYRRPGSGWQTASCAGTRFKPLERSNDGLVWLIGALKRQQETVCVKLAELPSLKELRIPVRGGEPRVFVPGDPGWLRHYRALEANLTAEQVSLERELAHLAEVLAKWVQTEAG